MRWRTDIRSAIALQTAIRPIATPASAWSIVNKTLIPDGIAALTFVAAGFACVRSDDSPEPQRQAAPQVKPGIDKMTLGQRDNPQDRRRQMNHAGSSESASTPRRARGAGPGHDLYKGSKLPSAHHNKPEYVVDDWRARPLGAPPGTSLITPVCSKSNRAATEDMRCHD